MGANKVMGRKKKNDTAVHPYFSERREENGGKSGKNERRSTKRMFSFRQLYSISRIDGKWFGDNDKNLQCLQ